MKREYIYIGIVVGLVVACVSTVGVHHREEFSAWLHPILNHAGEFLQGGNMLGAGAGTGNTTLLPDGASLSTALRNAGPGDTIVLTDGATYKFSSEVNTMRYASDVTITSQTPRNAILDCAVVCYMSGSKNVIFKELHIKGRINTDGLGTPGDSSNVQFIDNYWESGNNGYTENLKGAHQSGMTVRGNVFERNGTGASDRLLDWVNVDDSIIENNAFVKGNTGAIQIKGGSERNIVKNNYVLVGGQRAIQLGGSTCWDPLTETGCWGRNPDNSVIHPDDVGWEAIDNEMYDNIIVANFSCFSLSTQKNSEVHHNTCYMPPSTGGQYFMRFMQEVESDMTGLIEPSQYGSIHDNIFLYPVTKDAGTAGVNSQLVNFTDTGVTMDTWDERTRQLIDTFSFDRNAYYAITPITNSGFGNQATPIYPHRHTVGGLPWNPWAWKTNWINQVPAGIIDWGLPTMHPTASTYTSGDEIGARVSEDNPIGPDWWTPTADLLPADPKEKDEYPDGTPFYGWEGPGSYVAEPDDSGDDENSETEVSIKIANVTKAISGTYIIFNTSGTELSRGDFTTDAQGGATITLPEDAPTNVLVRLKPVDYLSATVAVDKTQNTTFTFRPKIGDFDGDGVVDSADAQVFIQRWKNNNINNIDRNGDGYVNALDYSAFFVNWDKEDE